MTGQSTCTSNLETFDVRGFIVPKSCFAQNPFQGKAYFMGTNMRVVFIEHLEFFQFFVCFYSGNTVAYFH
jgi:hypothetical protein